MLGCWPILVPHRSVQDRAVSRSNSPRLVLSAQEFAVCADELLKGSRPVVDLASANGSEDAMKKEALDSVLGRGKPGFDLGPIEDQLHAVANEQQLPDVAIIHCIARIEESAPALRAVVTRAAEGEALSRDDQMLLLRGIYILGGARDTRTFGPLLRLLRRPGRDLDDLLGDVVTESMARIVAGVFDGDADALFSLISDRSVDEFVRDAVLGAATFLTWEGRIERDRMRDFLERFHTERLADDDDFAWIVWLGAIALLGLRDLASLVHSAWDDGRIPEGVIDRRDFEDDLLAAEQSPNDMDRFERAALGYIDDVLEALEWTSHLEYFGEEDWQSPLPEQTWLDELSRLTAPVTNPWRHVGRNDPCPCGSGKKAKKCCLAN
ncbi:DUF1186 domain-containing protein [Mesorhizobium sp. M0520]|uniref:DUF1186 domain-containing protein n=1 Tax=Mesorhizobium sp. M0520 TaxID=2956957 RepID=UPI0033350C73